MSQTTVLTAPTPAVLQVHADVVGSIRARSPRPDGPQSTPTKYEREFESIEMEDMSPNGTVQSVGSSGIVVAVDVPWWKPHLQFFALCWAFYTAGWNDGTTGTLLPRIQSDYNVGYTTVSLVFIANFFGFVVGALANMRVVDKLGFGTAMAMGASTLVLGYALQAPAPPFPVFVIAYGVVGFGLALQEAGANSYVASLKKSPATKMGMLHALYGAGALCSPLSATQFTHMERWSFQFLTSLGLAVTDALLLMTVFHFKRQEVCLAEIGQAPEPHATEREESHKYRQLFRLKELHLLAFFLLVYVGVAGSIGGWTVTYIINVRGGGPSSGYISSGFFGGLTLGRVGLLWVNKKIGERRVMFLYTIIAIALELIAWLVPSLIGDAVAVSIIGFVLGPVFPLVMRHATKILPPYLLTGCIGWIAGFGQAGSAFIPFLTGAIASKRGIQTLQPLLVGMMGLMLCLWAIVPYSPKRLE